MYMDMMMKLVQQKFLKISPRDQSCDHECKQEVRNRDECISSR